MTFHLSQRSIARLQQCHPDLRRVIEEAIKITPVDFAVTETLRTKKRQEELIAAGVSWTMDSRHLPHPSDGLSRAADLVALDKGMPTWAWLPYYQIAWAVQVAAKKLDVEVVWGGCWDRALNDLGTDMEVEVMEYIARRKALGKKARVDGPHYQLSVEKYP